MPAPDKSYQFQIVDDLGNADGNADVIGLVSAVRAATVNIDLINPGARGAIITLDITVVPGTDTVTPSWTYKDPASGKFLALGAAGGAQVGVVTVKIPDLSCRGGQCFFYGRHCGEHPAHLADHDHALGGVELHVFRGRAIPDIRGALWRQTRASLSAVSGGQTRSIPACPIPCR